MKKRAPIKLFKKATSEAAISTVVAFALLFSLTVQAVAPAGFLLAQDDDITVQTEDGQDAENNQDGQDGADEPQDTDPGDNTQGSDGPDGTNDGLTVIDTGDVDVDADVDNDVNTNLTQQQGSSTTPTSTDSGEPDEPNGTSSPTSSEPLVNGTSSPTSSEPLVEESQTDEPSQADNEPPGLPQNVTAEVISDTQVNLNWEAATDNVGVAGYYIYLDLWSEPIATLGSNVLFYADTAREPETEYTYGISAFDAAGNEGARSLPVIVTTPASNDSEDLEPEENSTSTSALLSTQDNNDTANSTDPLIVKNANDGEVDSGVGADGNSGENTGSNNDGDVLIDTGDVDVDADVDSTVNTNVTDPGFDELADGCQTPDNNCGADGNLDAENQNTATTTTGVDADGNSGDNDASSNDGDVEIDTGDVDVDVNVSNVVNTNITGNGEFNAVDVQDDAQGDLDHSSSSGDPYQDSEVLQNGGATSTSLEVSNANDANVSNEIDVDANSGHNTASGNGGGAFIETGNVNVDVNVSNVVNTNISGNDWFYSIVNIFGDWEGDYILPNRSTTSQQSQDDSNSVPVDVQVRNGNTADVINDIALQASSGNNLASGDGTVLTGASNAVANIFNLINSNLFGSGWDFVKVNIFGNWSGQIFGLPDGAEYFETKDGILIWNGHNPEASDLVAQQQGYQFNSGSSIVVNNENHATVTNTIDVLANSGNNTAADNDGASIVRTGNVDAQVNVSNIVNTNLFGDNWLYSLINVFGNWLGNLEFGRPDLWVSEVKLVKNEPVRQGEIVTYMFNYGNRGDGTAEDVYIYDDYHEGLLNIVSLNGGRLMDGGVQWSVGKLAPGQTGTISYQVEMDGPINNSGDFMVENQVVIFSGQQEDRNMADNFSSSAFSANTGRATQPHSVQVALGDSRPKAGPNGWKNAELKITKTHNAGVRTARGLTVSYTIVVENIGDLSAFDTVVQDVLKDGEGNEVATNQWPLDEVYGNEEITINYDIELTENAPLGTYLNSAIVEGWSEPLDRWITATASAELEVGLSGQGAFEEVLDSLGLEDIVTPPAESLSEDGEWEYVSDSLAIGPSQVVRTQRPDVVNTDSDDFDGADLANAGTVLGAISTGGNDQPPAAGQSLDTQIMTMFIWLLFLIAALMYLGVRGAFQPL